MACPVRQSLSDEQDSLSQERECATEVESAMLAGLETVLVLPFDAHYTEWPSRRVLVVSAITRSEAGEYRCALSEGPSA